MTGKSVLSNFIWRLAERSGAQIVQLVVSIVLARLLAPTDYGVVALMNVFISILGIFINCGLGTALIQKKDSDNVDFSTVFYAQLAFCGVIYTGLFIAAPFIAEFYNLPEMTPMVRSGSSLRPWEAQSVRLVLELVWHVWVLVHGHLLHKVYLIMLSIH